MYWIMTELTDAFKINGCLFEKILRRAMLEVIWIINKFKQQEM